MSIYTGTPSKSPLIYLRIILDNSGIKLLSHWPTGKRRASQKFQNYILLLRIEVAPPMVGGLNFY